MKPATVIRLLPITLVGPTCWSAWMWTRGSASLPGLGAPTSPRSADFQSAVSPTSSRQTVRGSQRQRIGNPRYSRFETCATNEAGLRLRNKQRAFSLIEIMVAVALLAIIIVGLLAMFYQVQRAFRGGKAQVDVMESGRAGMSQISREAQEAAATQLDGVTNMAVVVPVDFSDNRPAPTSASRQTLPGSEIRQNYLRDFFFLSRVNEDEWIGTAYRMSNAVSGVGTLYRLVERQPATNLASLADTLSRSTPYNNTNFRRVMDGVVHFTVDFYDANGLLIPGTNNAYLPPGLGFAVTNGMLPAYLEVELAVLEPVQLEKFHYRYDVNQIQAGIYLANQAARTHVFRQRVPIRPNSADFGQ